MDSSDSGAEHVEASVLIKGLHENVTVSAKLCCPGIHLGKENHNLCPFSLLMILARAEAH